MAGAINVYVGSSILPGTFPLSVSGNSRYLVGKNGSPFFALGGSPQSMTVNMAATDQATSADAGVWFSTRKAQGFNAAWINILCGSGNGGRADKSTFDGITPFTSTLGGGEYNLSTPRTTYWSRMDQFIQIGTNYGFLLMIGPAETISCLAMLQANGVTACQNYGAFIANRYMSYSNVWWHHGNDFFSWNNTGTSTPSSDNQYVLAVRDGIKNTGHPGLHSLNMEPPPPAADNDSNATGDSLANSDWAGKLDANDIYTYNPAYAALRTGYNRSSFIPTYLGEASYEHEHLAGATDGVPLEIRRQAYWTLTNGGSGMLYGENHEWQTSTSWETYLASPNSPGASHLTHFKNFLNGIAWHTLIPDQSNTFLTSGTGTSGTFSYNTAAKNSAGTLGVVAVTFTGSVTVNLALMAGAVTARWYDPTNGTYTSAGSGLTGSHVFTHPGNNAGGDPDRVLLLEA